MKPKNVDDYIKQFPPETQSRLNALREMIRQEVPAAVESISYGMPAYKFKGKPLIYFAAYDHHIGIYATPQAHEKFAQELKGYKQGKGSVQFPLDQDLPLPLIRSMLLFKLDALK